MASTEQQSGAADQHEPENGEWQAQAWVYFIWVTIERRVYCKVGCSTDPGARLTQLQPGFPEEPFRLHLVPCLSMEQAKLFERMFHARLKAFKTRGEWFTHPNVKHLARMLGQQVLEILLLFETFGYENDVEQIDLSGKYPLLYGNGFVCDIVE